MNVDPVAFLKDFGPTIALLGYFVYKDWKFTQRITDLMAKIEEYLELNHKAARAACN